MSGCDHEKCLRDGCETCCYCGLHLKKYHTHVAKLTRVYFVFRGVHYTGV